MMPNWTSVTTIPAAANIAAALPFGLWREVGGSLVQLLVSITGMACAGWLTLVVQQVVWERVLSNRTPSEPGGRRVME